MPYLDVGTKAKKMWRSKVSKRAGSSCNTGTPKAKPEVKKPTTKKK